MRVTLKQHCTGTTLIEVMVTVVILAISLIGIAGLQVFGVRHNHSAYLRSQSTILAYDILDRMRANRTMSATTNAYLLNFGDFVPPAGTDCSDDSQTCTPLEIAQYDMSQWATAVAGVMPLGEAQIQVQDLPDRRIYTISLKWRDRRDTNDPEEIITPFVYRAEL